MTSKSHKKGILLKSAKSIGISYATTVDGYQIATLEISNNSGEVATLTYDKHHQTLTFDRTESGQTAFSKYFPGKVKMPIFPRKGDNMDQVTIDVFVDNCSVEIFDADGRFALTNLIFPNEPMCNYHVQ